MTLRLANADAMLVQHIAHVLGALEVTAYRAEAIPGLVVRARWPGLTVTTGLDDEDLVNIAAGAGREQRLTSVVVGRFRRELGLVAEETPTYVAVLEELRR